VADQPVQSVRNAWINRLRGEALRMRRQEVSKAAQVGVWIATYADADGSSAFPSAATLAAIVGCSEETVTRCVRLLMAVGLLRRKRRPNQSAVYQLIIPVERPAWEANLHVWGVSRQARARKKAKEEEMAEPPARIPSGDGFRNPSPVKVPEPVPGGDPAESGTRPRTGAETVPGRGPEPVPGGAYQYIPTYGRDPDPDQNVAEHSPQPQTPAAAREENDDSGMAQRTGQQAGLRPLPPLGSHGRRAKADAARSSQPPLLMTVQGEGAPPAPPVDVDPAAVRTAVLERGEGEAMRAYGWRTVWQHARDLLADHTDTRHA